MLLLNQTVHRLIDLALEEDIGPGDITTQAVVLDLLATFLDEDVELKDAQRLLDHSLGLLTQLSNSAPVVISVRPIPLIAHQRAVLLELLKNNVDVCWEEPLALQSTQQTQMLLFG